VRFLLFELHTAHHGRIAVSNDALLAAMHASTSA
jgi:hypothetical protein